MQHSPSHANRIYKRALVAGWFSYPGRNSTFGDVACKDVVCEWLAGLEIQTDVAGHPATSVEGVNIESVNPVDYDLFIFVCGPWFGEGNILQRFQHCTKIGVNLTISNHQNHGFDILFSRDDPGSSNPDIAFASQHTVVKLPVIGLVLVHPQPEYGDRQRHSRVEQVIEDYLERHPVAWIKLDTLIEHNNTPTRHLAQFEELLQRVDVIISTRLHGIVFALKNGTPVVAIDPIAGGAKVSAQAHALNWPHLLDGDTVQVDDIAQHINLCLRSDIHQTINKIQAAALERVALIRGVFEQSVANGRILSIGEV